MKNSKRAKKNVPTLLYVPVPHRGYLEFFRRHRRVSNELWLVGEGLLKEFPSLHSEIRGVDPPLMKKMLSALKVFKRIKILDRHNVGFVKPSRVITAPEKISRQVIAKYFPDTEVIIDDTVFLRYDESNVKVMKPVNFDRESDDLFDHSLMELALDKAIESSDWWRRVGAVIAKERQVLAVSHNEAVPSNHMPYIVGNPRDFIEAGMLSNFSDTLHAEKAVLTELLQRGVSTLGADIYVSVFPCPDCAKLIAYSGIRRCFFGSGHASLDGEKVLKDKGVELIYVPIEPRA